MNPKKFPSSGVIHPTTCEGGKINPPRGAWFYHAIKYCIFFYFYAALYIFTLLNKIKYSHV